MRKLPPASLNLVKELSPRTGDELLKRRENIDLEQSSQTRLQVLALKTHIASHWEGIPRHCINNLLEMVVREAGQLGTLYTLTCLNQTSLQDVLGNALHMRSTRVSFADRTPSPALRAVELAVDAEHRQLIGLLCAMDATQREAASSWSLSSPAAGVYANAQYLVPDPEAVANAQHSPENFEVDLALLNADMVFPSAAARHFLVKTSAGHSAYQAEATRTNPFRILIEALLELLLHSYPEYEAKKVALELRYRERMNCPGITFELDPRYISPVLKQLVTAMPSLPKRTEKDLPRLMQLAMDSLKGCL